MGLVLNLAKCEVINTHEVHLPPLLFYLTPSCDMLPSSEHLFQLEEFSMLPWKCAVQRFHLAFSRLPSIATHDALSLFRSYSPV